MFTPNSKAKAKKKQKAKLRNYADTSPFVDSESQNEKDENMMSGNSLIYEEKSKSRALKCLSFNMIC